MTSIHELDLSVRAYNCLHRAGYDHIEDLIDLEKEDYYKIRNLGNKCMKEILIKLEDYLKEHPITPEPLPEFPEVFNFTIDTSFIKDVIKTNLGRNMRYDDRDFRPIVSRIIKEVIDDNKDIIIKQAVEIAAEKIAKEALPKLIERMTK